ncbi:head maturation protease, ClpP-related [Edaphosphingomonas haloaromaticamans]|uniref:ATP-dependent Clp protease proteolytic subunit n=1 Tax=Edaphosphingomonas haloaromaticamans TaxID=653954 RepID=A0A1S1HCQ7_9SPHN|nr:head maturation protease, ClpP-related [Sphingomonas haloaromaticamans]OHT19917.1 ATP-dependent Clp protease proteolytic subunit [Sphingomonas haloaromaticamans]
MNRKLFALARDNAGRGSGIRSEASGDSATIYIYDVIDAYWGVSAADVAAELSKITAKNLTVRINTPGGDVFEARAIMTLLVEHPAKITAKIDGVAASAGSVIALAAETVEIADGGFYMIHKGWTFVMGNADDLRTTAGLLDKIDASLIADYVAKTGKDAAEIETLMKAETWFSAEEAVAAGFVDAIMPTTAAKAKANARAFNLAIYDKAPQALTEPEPEPDDSVRERMLARLGLYERTAA